MACTWSGCPSPRLDCRTRAAAAHPTGLVMSRRSRRMANSRNTKARSLARWGRGSLFWQVDSSLAHERSVDLARPYRLAVGRGRLKPAGLDPRRLFVAALCDRGLALARTPTRSGARQALYVRLGDTVRHSVHDVCNH